jgi:hypothetical protein
MGEPAAILLFASRKSSNRNARVSDELSRKGNVTEKNTPEVVLRVRITGIPPAGEFDEFDLRRYRIGDIYELPLRLATLLIIGGFAESAGKTVHAEAADFGGPRIPRNSRR